MTASRVRLPGELVTLRPLRRADLDPVVASMMRWVTDGTPEHVVCDNVRTRIERSGRMNEKELLLGIEAEGRIVGDVQARPDGLPHGVFELGISVFREEDRGRGYGREAVSLLTSYLFAEASAHRVQLSTDVGNAPMRAVAERLGFECEGVMRGFRPESDGPHDYAMYGMTKGDHEDVRTRWI